MEVEASDNTGLGATCTTGFGAGAQTEAVTCSVSHVAREVRVQTFSRPVGSWFACECGFLEWPPFEVFLIPATDDTSLMTLLA